jgi:DNA-binding HxlR family transcriptional regulator
VSAVAAPSSPAVARADDTRRPPRSDLRLIDSVNGTLELLQGKWKVHLLFFMARGIHRHSRLLECLPGASKKVMIDTLRALERDGLVARRIYAEVPVRVEYSLTALGWSITEPLVALSDWGRVHAADVARAREEYTPPTPARTAPEPLALRSARRTDR